jgi:solute:Na+ symporter, SSS family
LQIALGYIVGRAIIVYVLLPLYFRGQLMTAYEVLEKRFGGLTRRAASLVFLIARNLGDGLRLFLVAIVFEKLTGLPFAWSVVLMGTIATVYTFVGGMRSVIWNDCIQLGVYVLGAIAAVFVIANGISGGFGEVLRFARESGKLSMFDFRLSLSDPYTFWAALIGGAFLTIGTHGTDHSMVQRYLSGRSQADAGRAILLSGFLVLLQFAMFLFIGIELACYYGQHPAATELKRDEVFAHFIVFEFPRNTGLVGLMLAAILASNLSSSLNSAAAAVVNDFYIPWRKTLASDAHLLNVTRVLTIVFGMVQIAIGIWAIKLYKIDATVVDNALAIAGFTFGLLLGVFALGVLTRRPGEAAALIGAATGLAVLLLLHFGVPRLTALGYLPIGSKVAFTWMAVIGSTTTFLVGCLVGLVIPRQTTATSGATT